jgi:metal-responsive CopG/Arc/MetJ family transcriptional regulator
MEKLSAAVWIKVYEDDLEKLDNMAVEVGRKRSQLIRVFIHSIFREEFRFAYLYSTYQNRPYKLHPLSKALWTKLYEEDLDKLDVRVKQYGMSRSELIRVLLHELLNERK